MEYRSRLVGVALVTGAVVAAALVYNVYVNRDSKVKQKQVTVPSKKKDEEALPDIEDLMGKSLIPSTLKQMKAENTKPLTRGEKAIKVKELESMDIPKFIQTVGKKIPRQHTSTMQINVGYYCDQACRHCHVDSSPKRKEMMNKKVAQKLVKVIENSPSISVVDLTGGAPELNREFRYLVRSCYALGKEIIDRCNLTVLLEPHQQDLAQFLADHKVHIIASLPCYLEDNVSSQRGNEVFERSILALQLLNKIGYGKPGTGLILDLVYNPTGIHLPPPKEKLKVDYKRVLLERYDIVFNDLHCITNMPINRYYDHLVREGKLEYYMHLLVNSFNPSTVDELMCRTYLSIDPFGNIFDCDFNQQLDLHLPKKKTVFDIDCTDDLLDTGIVTRKHCYGCTAGQGSS